MVLNAGGENRVVYLPGRMTCIAQPPASCLDTLAMIQVFGRGWTRTNTLIYPPSFQSDSKKCQTSWKSEVRKYKSTQKGTQANFNNVFWVWITSSTRTGWLLPIISKLLKMRFQVSRLWVNQSFVKLQWWLLSMFFWSTNTHERIRCQYDCNTAYSMDQIGLSCLLESYPPAKVENRRTRSSACSGLCKPYHHICCFLFPWSVSISTRKKITIFNKNLLLKASS